MKKLTQVTVVAAALVMLGMPGNVWASSVDDNDGVNVVVDPILSITDSLENFTLVFNTATGTATNSISTSQDLAYAVEANNMPTTVLPGALSAKISIVSQRIELRATPGTYVADPTNDPGNATLTPVGANPVPLGAMAAALFNKGPFGGDLPLLAEGKVMKGIANVRVNGKALANLSPADNFSTTLTVTLKDA